jgi:surfeit locus 1 family protein
LPQAGIHMASPSNATRWPKVMNFPTYDELYALFGNKLFNKIVLLDPAEADGLQRDWTSRYTFGEFGPDRHIAYALQWFGLSATLAVLFLLTQFRKNADDQQ